MPTSKEIWYAMLGPEIVNVQHMQCMPLTLKYAYVCTYAAHVSWGIQCMSVDISCMLDIKVSLSVMYSVCLTLK